MKNIEIVTKYFYPVRGGIENSILEVYSRLAKWGYQVKVHATGRTIDSKEILPKEAEIRGLRVQRYPQNLLGYWPKINWKKTDYIILTNFNIFPHSLIMAYSLFLKILGRKRYLLILTPHGGMTPNYKNLSRFTGLAKIIFNKTLMKYLVSFSVDYIRVVSEWEKRQISKIGIRKSLLTFIPDGIENEAFENPDKVAGSYIKSLRKKIGTYFIQLGKVHPTKKVETCLRALKLLDRKVNFIIVGEIKNLNYKKYLDELIKELDLEDRVYFIDKSIKVYDKYYLLKNALLLVHPAVWESFGRVVHEALAQGLPVVISDNIAPSFLMKEKVNGFKINSFDYKKLARTIRMVLKNKNTTKMKEISENNKKLVIKNSWEEVAKSLDKFFNKIDVSKKYLRYLIANSGNPKNISTLINLNVVKDLINKAGISYKIIIHSSNPERKNLRISEFWNYSLYSYILLENMNFLIRFTRTSRFIFYMFIILLGVKEIPYLAKVDKLYKIAIDHLNSDTVIFLGGNYLKSDKTIKGIIELFLNLLIIEFSKLTSRRQIILPITFGPFYYKWLEKITTRILKDVKLVSVRDKNSYQILNKCLKGNLVLSTDIILLDNVHTRKKVMSKNSVHIGLGIRNWDAIGKYEKYDQVLTNSLNKFAKHKDTHVIPIHLEDISNGQTQELKNERNLLDSIEFFDKKICNAKYLSSQRSLVNTFSRLDLIIAPRTNLCLLATLYKKPFLAINPKSKVKHILKTLNLDNLYLNHNMINSKSLYSHLLKVYKERYEIENKLEALYKELLLSERRRWSYILTDQFN